MIAILYFIFDKYIMKHQCVMDYMKNNLFSNLSPSLIMTDFEPALRDALCSSVGVEGY